MVRPSAPPPECAICGADIPRSAKACPDCGADERTGWREQNLYDGLDLPASAWSEESPASGESLPSGGPGQLAWYWWATGAALMILLILTFLGLR